MNSRARVIGLVVTASLIAVGCGGGGDGGGAGEAEPTVADDSSTSVTSTPSAGTADHDAVQSEIDALMALSPDEQLAAAGEADLELELLLAAADESGLQDALGGPDQTRAALAAHGAALAVLAETITAEPLQVGIRQAAARAQTPNIGAGMFGGYMVVALGAGGAIAATNDGSTGSRTTGTDPTNQMVVTATDSDVSVSADATIEDHGVTSVLKVKLKMVPCPDPNGQFTAEASIDITTTAAGGGAGQSGTLEVQMTGQLDDDARLADKQMNYQMHWGGFEMGSFVDLSVSQGAGGTFASEVTGLNWFTTKREHVTLTETVAGLFAAMIQHWVMDAVMSGIESGRCVEIGYGVSPGTTGLEPSSTATINAAPRAKIDGKPTGGTVKAELTAGGAGVSPSGTKVPAVAEFTYTAPDEKNKTGTVSLEARSKRGVGRVDIHFDTNQAGYIASGGETVTFTGTIDDLAAPFTLAGTGPGFTVVFSFTPTDATAGMLTYSGGGGGATLGGSGTYTITGNDPDLLMLNYETEGCADVGTCTTTANAITLTRIK